MIRRQWWQQSLIVVIDPRHRYQLFPTAVEWDINCFPLSFQMIGLALFREYNLHSKVAHFSSLEVDRWSWQKMTTAEMLGQVGAIKNGIPIEIKTEGASKEIPTIYALTSRSFNWPVAQMTKKIENAEWLHHNLTDPTGCKKLTKHP